MNKTYLGWWNLPRLVVFFSSLKSPYCDIADPQIWSFPQGSKAKKSTKKLNSISLLPFLLVLISVSGAIFRHLVPPLPAVENSQSPNMWLEPLHESTCFPGSEEKWEESSSQFLDSFRRQEKKTLVGIPTLKW